MPSTQPAVMIVVSKVYNLNNCPLFEFPIKADRCLEQTRILRQNQHVCMRCKCHSPHRRCIKCLADGKWQSSKNIVIDFEKGLCGFHLNGESTAVFEPPKIRKVKKQKRIPHVRRPVVVSPARLSPSSPTPLPVPPVVMHKDPPELAEARNIREMMKTQQYTVTEIARKLDKSVGWVHTRLRLLYLDPKVCELMLPVPGKYRLSVTIASCLGGISTSLQIELAYEIVRRSLKVAEAIDLIRQRMQ